MYLEYRQHLGTGDIVLDGDIRGLKVVALPAGSFLLSSTGLNGGLVSYALAADGRVTGVSGRSYFAPEAGMQVSGMMDVVAVGTSATVVLGGGTGTSMTRYTLSGNGSVSAGTASAAGSPAHMVSATELDSGIVYHAVLAQNGQILRDAPGQSAVVENVVLDGVMAFHSVDVGGGHFLLATQYGTQGISSYRIDDTTGALSLVDELGAAQGLGIHAPTAFEMVSAFGTTWVLLGSAGTSTLSVVEMSPGGQFTAVDHVMDTRETRFGGVQSVATAQVGDRVFVVAGGADDGLSLFTLLPDGRLIHLDTIAHTSGAGLMNVGEIEATVLGDALQIFVSSGTDTGIARFSVDLSGLGGVWRGDANGANRLEGGTGDDLLIAGQGDTLVGGAGDDMLVGALSAELTGGAGADAFVLTETGGTTRILDFTPGVDRLDLSLYFMLRTIGQLSIESTSSGARIRLRDTVIDVRAANGTSLDRDALFGRGFDWADRIPIFERTAAPTPTPDPDPVDVSIVVTGSDGPDMIEGAGAGDRLSGGAGHDTLSGHAGDDTLSGDSGDDVLEGGTGQDAMSGGSGDDTLRGDAGDDTLDGDGGADVLDGGAGNDVLRGRADDDLLRGGGEDDSLSGGDGRDTLLGGSGNDTLAGDDGDDVLYGDDGDDLMVGIKGNDTLYGEEGNDTLSGGTGADLIFGGNGHDDIWGGFGNDTLWGGNGDDRMGGSEDNDLMYGGHGNDTVWGGSQHDTLYGEDGSDNVGGFWGNDLAYGGAGDDFVWGNFGNDTLYGDDGNDMIGSAEGNDELFGGNGNDTLVAGDSEDTLWGGSGDDMLTGGAGDDWLSGGADADTFFFYHYHPGQDTIADFDPAVDLIQISSNAYTFQTLPMWQNGDDAILYLDRGTITLVDTDLTDLGAENFLFG